MPPGAWALLPSLPTDQQSSARPSHLQLGRYLQLSSSFSRTRAPWLPIPVRFPNQGKPPEHSSPGAWSKIWDLELQLKREMWQSSAETAFWLQEAEADEWLERSSISWMWGCDEHPGSGTKLPLDPWLAVWLQVSSPL